MALPRDLSPLLSGYQQFIRHVTRHNLLVLPQTALLLAVAICTLTATVHANGPVTVRIEPRDTAISNAGWENPPLYTRNYGRSATLRLERDDRGTLLLAFDLSAVPANSQIQQASLFLHCRTETQAVRRAGVQFVLAPWDEGTETGGSIDQPGEHGATGDFAVQYYPGEGTDVPWGKRGMAPDSDYVPAVLSEAGVGGIGWYQWDVSTPVKAWVNLGVANYGLRLRDLTGYAEGNPDTRMFDSREAPAADTHPYLLLTYNPDSPIARAGNDVTDYHWTRQTPILLDGSASADAPGGSGVLRFDWSVISGPPGSAAGSHSFSPNGTSGAVETAFLPDTAGAFTLRLTVTNAADYSNSDELRVKVLSISTGHPRIWLTPNRLATLRARAQADTPQWDRLAEYASTYAEVIPSALAWQAGQKNGHRTQALSAFRAVLRSTEYSNGRVLADVAIGYDWLWDQLTPDERNQALSWMNRGYEAQKSAYFPDTWGNHGVRFLYGIGLAGLAAFDEHPDALTWMNHARDERWTRAVGGGLQAMGDGGGWPEGTVYGFIVSEILAEYAAAVYSATGEDLFSDSPWFYGRMSYALLIGYPHTDGGTTRAFHPYPSLGDAERGRGTMTSYERHTAMILADRYRGDPIAAQLQAFLLTPPADRSLPFRYWADFLWLDPDDPGTPPSLLSHWCAGTGTVLLRSSWGEGDAATHLTYQCGDRFTYHQHQDQGAFTLWKGADLAIDSGVYEGYGNTTAYSHLQGYCSRAVAHNTVLIYNPDEVFRGYRSGNTVPNDGGQRTWRPGGNHPSLDEWLQHHEYYETGEIWRFCDQGQYVYIRSDVTGAYNSEQYCVPDCPPKLRRFNRELCYIRPAPGLTETLIVFDRVDVFSPDYEKKWLLHTLAEPSVDGPPTPISWGETLFAGSTATVTAGNSRLYIAALLPADARIRRIGGQIKGIAESVSANSLTDTDMNWAVNALAGNSLGFTSWQYSENHSRIVANSATELTVDGDLTGVAAGVQYSAGKDYWSFGSNFPAEPSDYETDYGAYRLEIEPGAPRTADEFLVILQPVLGTAPPAAVMRIDGQRVVGAQVDRQVVMFAHEITDVNQASYQVPGGGLFVHLVTGLTPGRRYDIARNGASVGAAEADSGGVVTFAAEGAATFYISGGATPTPTNTPTQSGSPTPTTTPTPTPASARTPSPTATWDPSEPKVELTLPQFIFRPGDLFYLHATVYQPAPNSSPGQLAVVLDVVGSYWFWPSWRAFPAIDAQPVNLQPGETEFEIIPEFTWPAGVGALSGIAFWGALLDIELTQILGHFDHVIWHVAS